jgi:hypothetical protein
MVYLFVTRYAGECHKQSLACASFSTVFFQRAALKLSAFRCGKLVHKPEAV